MPSFLDIDGLKYYTENLNTSNSDKISILNSELRTLISAAQSTANSAQSTANSAKTTANNAASTASSAYSLASSASSSASGKANIESGVYTGIGGAGSTVQNSLTFTFTPKFLVITSDSDGILVLCISGSNFKYYRLMSTIWCTMTFTFSGNKISWYGERADKQLNTSGKIYSYVALG